MKTRLALLLTAVFVTACTSVPSDKLQTFSVGVTTAKSQSNTAFVAVNTLTTDAVVDYAALQTTLKEENFYEVLDSDSVAQWQAVFSALEKYCQSLVLLTSPDLTKDYKADVISLATQIQETGNNLKSNQIVGKSPSLSPGIAAAVAETGNALLKVKANADAKKVVSKMDPSVRTALINMADSIGSTGKEGIRGTVYSNWEQLKTAQKAAFIAVPQKLKAPEMEDVKTAREKAEFVKKRAIAAEYASLRQKQIAQDQALDALQRSLRALADAHHALAKGSKLDVVAAINIVEEGAKETTDIYNRMNVGLNSSGSTK